MTLKDEKRQARHLYLSGVNAHDISKHLRLNIRTVQRWFAQWRNEESSGEQPITTNNVNFDKNQQSSTVVLGYLGNLQNWIEDFGQTCGELREMHRNLRIQILERLELELAGEAPNKIIHTLSLALTRHSQEEVKLLSQGRTDLLNLSQAVSLLTTAGYEIVHLDKNKNESVSPLSNELPFSENPEKN